jgi:signal transduction histidine kinase
MILPRGGVLGKVRWWWVLATGAGVGVLSHVLLYPVIFGGLLVLSVFKRDIQSSLVQFGEAYGVWGMPTMHMLLTLFATSWLARKVGTAAVTHGVLVAVVSVVVNQAIVLFTFPPLNPGEAAIYLVMALAGGLLGGAEGRSVLAGQEALHQVSRRISEARDPRAVLVAIYDYLVNSAIVGVVLWQVPDRTGDDSSGGSAALDAWAPWSVGDWPEGTGFDRLDASVLIGADRRSPRMLRVSDLPARERTAWRSRDIRSAFLLPLITPGSARIWLLAVASRRRRLPRSTVRACLTVEAQVALALENLRLVEEARRAGRQAGVLRERQRLAHEIHDTLAQGFTSIVMNLEAAEGAMPSNTDRARHHLDQARLTARESLTEARRLVWALRPEALENASLPEALKRLTERWRGESSIIADVATTGTPCPLPSELEATLFRVAQEALSNVRKHARGASRVALTLSYMGDTVALDARDDGEGFDPDREAGKVRDQNSGGFGLRGMRERVERVGGTLSVESAPGEGTTLAVELPVSTRGLEFESSPREKSLRGVEEVT